MSSHSDLPSEGRVKARVPSVIRRVLRHATWWKVHRLETRVAALEKQAQAALQSLSVIDCALHTPPYVAQPSTIELVDEDGTTILGFDGAADRGEGVYVAFEDVFRGSEDFIRERQECYLQHLVGRRSVADLGCGRGELLDLLAAVNVPCVGVEPDAGAVSRARAKGHRIVQTDALSFLRDTEPRSLGGIVSLQFIEHIGYDDLLELLRLSVSRLEPGGIFIAETVNPHSIAGLRTFWVDLTHNKPIFPESLLVLCRASGFHCGRIVYPCGTGNYEHDRRNAGEYAVIASVAP